MTLDDRVRMHTRITLREIQQEIDYLGERKFCEDPAPGAPPPPSYCTYPALIRARFRQLFDRAEQRGLPREARIALEVFCLETLQVEGHGVLGEESKR